MKSPCRDDAREIGVEAVCGSVRGHIGLNVGPIRGRLLGEATSASERRRFLEDAGWMGTGDDTIDAGVISCASSCQLYSSVDIEGGVFDSEAGSDASGRGVKAVASRGGLGSSELCDLSTRKGSHTCTSDMGSSLRQGVKRRLPHG